MKIKSKIVTVAMLLLCAPIASFAQNYSIKPPARIIDIGSIGMGNPVSSVPSGNRYGVNPPAISVNIGAIESVRPVGGSVNQIPSRSLVAPEVQYAPGGYAISSSGE